MYWDVKYVHFKLQGVSPAQQDWRLMLIKSQELHWLHPDKLCSNLKLIRLLDTRKDIGNEILISPVDLHQELNRFIFFIWFSAFL